MKLHIKALLILLPAMLSCQAALSQSIDPDLLRKAKAMGLTEEQLRNELRLQEKEKQKTSDPKKDFSQKSLKRDTTDYLLLNGIDSTFWDKLKKKYKKEEPKIFGRDIFLNKNITFSPNTNLPTPKNYVLASDDEIVINIWGSSENTFREIISPEGNIFLPGVGQIALSGMTIEDASKKINLQLKKIISDLGTGSFANISLGNIRSIKVNVTGEVTVPGSYTVSSLSTVFHALYLSGGITPIGSLREVNVYRNSKLVASLDVYDYIINGNSSANIVLKEGDMIIVKPYLNRLTIAGSVKRPMLYESKPNETLEQALVFAGGFAAEAYREEARIDRKSGKLREALNIPARQFSQFVLLDGDSITIDKQSKEYANKLSIKGAVWREGNYQLDEDTKTISLLIKKAGGLKGNEFATRGLITRTNDDYSKSSIGFVTRDIVSGKSDVTLQKNDEIYIPILDSLREKQIITVKGEVNHPDTIIPFAQGMRVEDAIILAGGLKESASYAEMVIARRTKDPQSTQYTGKLAEIIRLSINGDLTIPEEINIILSPFDEIFVKPSPAYSKQKHVKISGEVLFPGTYVLDSNNVRLSDIMKRVRGVKPDAYLKGTSLKRQFTEADKETLAALENVIKQQSSTKDSLSNEQLGLTKKFPIAIDMEAALKNPKGVQDVVLMEGDEIHVPKFDNTVTVLGGVNYPNAMTFNGKNLRKYINEAGSYQRYARKKPFVIYKNGSVLSSKKFIFAKHPKIEPGCIIVVPIKSVNSRMSTAEVMSLTTGATSLASSLATLGISLGTLKK